MGLLLVLGLVGPGLPVGAQVRAAPLPGDNVVLQWNNAALEAVRRSQLGAPMVSRALAIVHTCMFDAWAAYDARAVGTRLGSSLRRPRRQRRLPRKVEAVSVAAHRALVDLFPAERPRFDGLLRSLGFDPSNATTDTRTPAGVGAVACSAVLEFRHHDGSNQLGDLGGGPYADYTGYRPVNDPMVLPGFDPTALSDPNRWQPLVHPDESGNLVVQTFEGAQWHRVTPFALASPSELRSADGPWRYPSPQYTDQAVELLQLSAGLTDEHKAIVEYWLDGPGTETPPGHWNLFAQFVSRRDAHDLDADVKLFFALNNALLDAGIASWDDKRAFDSVRPISAIRFLFRGRDVLAWAGPGRGTQVIKGETWLPYHPPTLPTPPFPEYTSGHSTFSGAAAEILRLFTGSEAFGASASIPAGSSQIEPGLTPRAPVTLSWPTFRSAADEAGMSRRYGGIHFAKGDLDGRALGRAVAARAWSKALSHFGGASR